MADKAEMVRRDRTEAAQRRVLRTLDELEKAIVARHLSGERAASRARRVAARQDAVLKSISELESILGVVVVVKDKRAGDGSGDGGDARFPLPHGPPETSCSDDEGRTAVRLNAELTSKGAPPAAFVRVPAQYYDEDLPFRMACLKAPSVHHLCKTICMENTKCTRSDCEDRNNSKWYLVVVQYTARLNQQKLEKFLHTLNGGAIGKKNFHMRLAKEEDSEELTGYVHGGVAPVGLASDIPGRAGAVFHTRPTRFVTTA